MEFENKVLTIYKGLISCLDPDNENFTPLEVKDIDAEFFAGGVHALFLLYTKVTRDDSMDVIDFMALLNKCVVQRLLMNNTKVEE